MITETLDADDKKIAEIEDFIDESNKYVASVLAQLDENKKRMEAMGWSAEKLSNMQISAEDHKFAMQELKRLGYEDLFAVLESDALPASAQTAEPDDYTVKVNRNMSRRFNMI